MPDWCLNDLTVSGEAARVELFLEMARGRGAGEALDFNQFVRYPERFRAADVAHDAWDAARGARPESGFSAGGRSWRMTNWGTKWNAYGSHVTARWGEGRGKGDFTYFANVRFETAYAPPLPVVRFMSQFFTGLRFDLRYLDPETGSVGFVLFRGGVAELCGHPERPGPGPSREVSLVTRELLWAAERGVWPGPAVVNDFGIASPKHLEAIASAVRYGDVTASDLDEACRYGEYIRQLLADAPHNPHKRLTFRTTFDDRRDLESGRKELPARTRRVPTIRPTTWRCTVSDDRDPAVGSQTLKPVTEALVEAIVLDLWPGGAVIADFGLVSTRHYEAVYYAVRHDDVSPAELDNAVGNGPLLTEMMERAEHNPHRGRGLVFTTPYDEVTPERRAFLERFANIGRLRARRQSREHEEERLCDQDIEPER